MPPIDYVIAPLCPEFQRTSLYPTIHSDCDTRPRATAEQRLTNTPLAAHPAKHAADTSDGWTLSRPHPKSHLAQSARWVEHGIETTTARYRGESTHVASIASGMLGMAICPRSSHRNRLRPAPLVGAFGRWLNRHPKDAGRLKVAASIYAQCAADVLCGTTVVACSPMAILARWMAHASTGGLDSKKKIYRATCEAIIAYMSDRTMLSIYEISQASCSTSSNDPIP